MNGKKNSRAFTLVEIVVVIAVIGILAAVLVPSFASILSRSRMNDHYERVTNARDDLFFSNDEFGNLSDMRGYLFIIDGEIYEVSSTGDIVKSDYDLGEYDMEDYEDVTQSKDSSVTILSPKAITAFDRAIKARNHYHKKNGLVDVVIDDVKKQVFYEMNHYIITVWDTDSNKDISYEVTYSQNKDGSINFDTNGALVLTSTTIEELADKGLYYTAAPGQDNDTWSGIVYVPTEETELYYRVLDLEKNLASDILWDDIELGFDAGNVKQSDYIYVVETAGGITLSSTASVTKGKMYGIDAEGRVYNLSDAVLADIQKEGYRFLASSEISESDLSDKIKSSNRGRLSYAKIDCYAIFYGYYNNDTSYSSDGYHLWTDFLVKYNGGNATDSLEYNSAMSDYGIRKLVVSDTIRSIKDGAFTNYTDMTEIILPENLTEIEVKTANPFANGKIEYVLVNDRNTVYSDYNNAGIIDKANEMLVMGTKKVLVNDQYLPEEILVVGKYAFEKSDLVQIDIIGKIVEVGALKGSEKLVNVTHNLDIIPAELFSGCINLKLISSLLDVTEIGEEAFRDCNNINDSNDAESSLELSTMLAVIGRDAFANNNIKLYYTSSRKTFRQIEGYENTNHMTIVYALKDITYDYQGGAIPENRPENPLVYDPNSNDEIVLTSPERDGSIFMSWSVVETEGSEIFADIVAGEDTTSPYKLKQGEAYNYKDITLIANYERVIFDIIYIVNGENVTEELDREFIRTFSKISTDAIWLPDMTKEYYDFDGWYDGDTFIDNWLNPYNRTENAVLTATFKPHEYTITYEYEGGYAENPATYTIETDTFTLEHPVKEDYTFVSWYIRTTNTHVEEVEIVKGNIPRDLVIVAEYTPTEYALNYEFKWGTVTLKGIENPLSNPNKFTVVTGILYFERPATIDGYDFVNWYIGNELLENGIFVCKDYHGDTTIVGQYTPWVYSVSYGNSSKMNGQSKEVVIDYNNGDTYYYGQDLYLNEPAMKNGYEFVGWRGLGAAQSWIISDSTGRYYIHNATDDMTILAEWQLINYTISYDMPEDAVETMTNPTSYTVEDEPIRLQPLTRTGYIFTGWTGSNGNVPQTEVVIKCSETFGQKTYYSNWKTSSYTIEYNNLLDSEYEGEGNPDEYTIETDTFTLENPVRRGYEFLGWSGTNISGMEKIVTVVKGSYNNRTYVANWTPIVYKIDYILNGGEEVPENKKEYTVESPDLLIKATERKGYKFLGWTGEDLEGLTESFTIAHGSIGHRTYEAKWEIIVYTITYTLQKDGEEYPKTLPVVDPENPITYTVEDDEIILTNPIGLGYEFLGWSGTDLGTGESRSMLVILEKGRIGHREYTAHWRIETYSIHYDYVDGVLGEGEENPANYTVEDITVTLYNPTKTGYKFIGWTGTGITVPQLVVQIIQGETVGDKEYKANYETIEYNLIINLEGGTGMKSTTYTIESDVIVIPEPTKTGYTFLGWTGTNGNVPNKNVMIVTGSIGHRTYTANWEIITYIISYSLNGGKVEGGVNPVTYDISSPDIILINPTKFGYTFAGWAGDTVTDPYYVVIESGSTGERSYQAMWTLNTYYIEYVSDSGLNVENPTSFDVTKEGFTLNNPTRKGYTFTGWTDGLYAGYEDDGYVPTLTEPTLTVIINPSITVGSRTYYANWNVIVYTINYTLYDGELPANTPHTYTVDTQNFTIGSPTKAYYRFDGWSGTGIGNESTDLQLTVDVLKGSTGDLVFTAHWTLMRFDIIYHAYTADELATTLYGLDGINEDFSLFPREYYSDNDSFQLINPTKEGYNFAGWQQYTPGTNNKINAPSKSVFIYKGDEGDKEFGATWSTIIYTITYNYNSGTLSSGSNPTQYTILSNNIELVNPSRIGYDFDGWTGTCGDTPTTIVIIGKGSTGNRNYTANFTPKEYEIILNDNGGNGGEGSVTATFDRILPSVKKPTRTGYNFNGYYYSSTQYYTSAGAGTRTWDRAEGVTMYAQWTAITITITFDKQSGSGGSNSTTATYDQLLTSGLSAPSRTGYTFGGYYTSTGGNGTRCYNESMSPLIYSTFTNNTTLYAKWTVISYTISYNYDGGSASNRTTYTIEDSFTLNNPTKSGHNFTGWTGSRSGTTVTISKGTTGALSFTANWSYAAGEQKGTFYTNHGMNNGYSDRVMAEWSRSGSDWRTLHIKLSVYYPENTTHFNYLQKRTLEVGGRQIWYADNILGNAANWKDPQNCVHGKVLWEGDIYFDRSWYPNGQHNVTIFIGFAFHDYGKYNATATETLSLGFF